jgi:hypothetical protein
MESFDVLLVARLPKVERTAPEEHPASSVI